MDQSLYEKLLKINLSFPLRITSEHNIIVAIAVILILLNVFTLLSNVTVMVALFKFYVTDKGRRGRRKEGHVITKMLMTSLAFANAFIAMFVMPLNVLEFLNNGEWTLSTNVCTARYDISNLLNIVTVYHVACMAIERYLAVCKPLRYRTIKKRIGYIIIGIAWVIPFCIAILPTINKWNEQGFQEIAAFLEKNGTCTKLFNKVFLITTISMALYAPLTITYILYAAILIEIIRCANRRKLLMTGLKRQVRKRSTIVADVNLRDTHVVETNDKNCSELNQLNSLSQQGSVPQELRVSEQNLKCSNAQNNGKAYRTIGSILLCMSACYLPVAIVISVFSYNTIYMPLWLTTLLSWLPLLNSTLNPLIYCTSMSVRRALHSLFITSSP